MRGFYIFVGQKTDIMIDKKALRQQIRELKKKFTSEQLSLESEKIMEKLSNNSDFQQSEIVMLYASLPDEVQTFPFIEKWRNRKRIRILYIQRVKL